jgi:hypothetical protein
VQHAFDVQALPSFTVHCAFVVQPATVTDPSQFDIPYPPAFVGWNLAEMVFKPTGSTVPALKIPLLPLGRSVDPILKKVDPGRVVAVWPMYPVGFVSTKVPYATV